MQVTIGLPRALLYHKYHVLWTSFFENIGIETVTSPQSNRAILDRDVELAVDETCVPLKVFLGHVDSLRGRVDYVLVPRIVTLAKGETACVKFLGAYDVTRNCMPDIPLIEYNVDVADGIRERDELCRLGRRFTNNSLRTVRRAYDDAKRKQDREHREVAAAQEALLDRPGEKVLVVGHAYNLYDDLLGRPIREALAKQGVEVLCSELADMEQARRLASLVSTDIPWTYNKELLGALEFFRERVDGVIFLVTFPCGPDSLMTELGMRRIKGTPAITIVLDELQGEAGLKTRLESFVDLLRAQKVDAAATRGGIAVTTDLSQVSGARKVSFPHLGNYSIPVRTLAEMLDCEVIEPPRMTRRTLEIGARHSPEFVCIPFKYNLGNYIEALEAGANLLIQAGGGCRFGYYGEVQEAILRDLGYEFDMVLLVGGFGIGEHYRDFKKVNPRLTMWRALSAYRVALRQTRALDRVEDYLRRNSAFQVAEGAFEYVHEEFLRALHAARDLREIERLESSTLARMAEIPTERPDDLLRVGIVGELYVLMEPFSNNFVERELAKRGVEVHRFVTVSAMVDHAGRKKQANLERLIGLADPYLKYHIGADGTESVAMTHKLMGDGFDGVLHLKPFGCMPEVNAMSALQRLSREHTFPVLFISYDAQTSEAGLTTRLDAFCDMLRMSKGRPGAALRPAGSSPPAEGSGLRA